MKSTKRKQDAQDVITLKEIENYVRIKRELAVLETTVRQLRDNLLSRLVGGTPCDRTGWLILTYTSYWRWHVDWEDQFKTLLAEIHPDDWETRFERLRNRVGRKTPVVALLVRANVPAVGEGKVKVRGR